MTCTCCSQSLRRHFMNLFGRVYFRHLAAAITLVYLFFGMILFNAVEAPYERQVIEENRRQLDLRQEIRERNLLQIIENITIDMTVPPAENFSLYNLSIISITPLPNETKKIVIKYVRTDRLCIERDPPAQNQSTKWDMAGALFFSLTMLTTIGYGNMAPATINGKSLCVIYALIGIPLLQIVLEHVRNFFIVMTIAIESHFTCAGFKNIHDRDAERTPEHILRHPKPWTVLLFLIGYVSLVFIPSAFFVLLEGWDYLSSLYYNFITLSTIGFGDMIASANASSPKSAYNTELHAIVYRAILSFWVLFGLTFASGVFDMLRHQLEKFLIFITARLCSTIGQDSNDDRTLETSNNVYAIEATGTPISAATKS